MGCFIVLHPTAQEEINESYLFYKERSEKLADRFMSAVQKLFDTLSATPDMFPKMRDDYRQTIVKKFPFVIIYEVLEHDRTVFVSHVFHTSRDPDLKYTT